MRRVFAAALACAAIIACAPVFGTVTGEWRVNLLRGSSTIGAGKGATQADAWFDCMAQIPPNAAAQVTYRCQTPVFTAIVTPDPPVCPPQPADESRPGECPAGSTGAWTQTLTYTSAPAPACWAAGSWTPSSPPAGACNRAPTISGTPLAAVQVGAAYSYTPTASDPDGDTLGFSIANRPSWASFDPATGRLSGTPGTANVGITSSIVITVSDGQASASTSAFTITVTAPAPPSPTVPTNLKATITPNQTNPANSNVTITWDPVQGTEIYEVWRCTGPNCTNFGFYEDCPEPVSKKALNQPPDSTAKYKVRAWKPTILAFSDVLTVTTPPAPTTEPPPPPPPPPATGSARISWTPPTANTDGTMLTNLAGWRIDYGPVGPEAGLNQSVEVRNSSVSSYLLEGLAVGTWAFAVSAFNSDGRYSAQSNVATKTVQ